ncbi:hypothetical protein DENSPDRAFT_885834 [Dentipellis sp. KUC8613]|nr:hypothetical protein DENSPDRAFT_885834 [Dentipellis sp. KUC8613]
MSRAPTAFFALIMHLLVCLATSPLPHPPACLRHCTPSLPSRSSTAVWHLNAAVAPHLCPFEPRSHHCIAAAMSGTPFNPLAHSSRTSRSMAPPRHSQGPCVTLARPRDGASRPANVTRDGASPSCIPPRCLAPATCCHPAIMHHSAAIP